MKLAVFAALVLVGWLALFVIVALCSFVLSRDGWATFFAALLVTAALVGFVWIAGER